MGFQLKRTFCSKIFAPGPSEIGKVVCQIENQIKSGKNQDDHILQVYTPIKTEPNLKLYGETLKVYPQVKFLGITFDSQLTFKKQFEDILDRCNTRYHRLRLLSSNVLHSRALVPWRCSTSLLCSVGPLERIFITLLAVLCWPSRMHIYCSVGLLECNVIVLLIL